MDRRPLVSIVMGSQSDLETLKEAAAVLREFAVTNEIRVIFYLRKRSMHRPVRIAMAQACVACYCLLT